MTSTDAPAPERSSRPRPRPPTRSESIQLRWRAIQRSIAVPVTAAAVAALVLGLLAGRATAPSVDTDAIAALERSVVPLAVDADAVWTAGTSGLPAVSSQLQRLRLGGDAEEVAPHVTGWLNAYDGVLRRIVGVEVPSEVRPVQRQFISAVTLSRDAVEVLATATQVADPATRRDLTSEALRLRIRSEQATQVAQAAIRDLRGGATGGVSVPAELPSLADLR